MPARRTSTTSTRRSTRSTAQRDAVAELIGKLFNSSTQAHILHLQTDSYAKHKALNKYYDGIVSLADKYAESYQGIYGIIKGYKASGKYKEGEAAIIPYFEKLEREVKALKPRLPKDEDLENAYADILDLIHSTIYLLTKLN